MIYLTLVGIGNFILVREVAYIGIRETILTGFGNKTIAYAAFYGLLVMLTGGVIHRYYDLNPDASDIKSIVIAVIVPFGVGFLSKDVLRRRTELSVIEQTSIEILDVGIGISIFAFALVCAYAALSTVKQTVDDLISDAGFTGANGISQHL
jgi:ACR3 family arsenite efflux pump ArsB